MKKNLFHRLLSAWLVVAMLIGCIPFGTVIASAAAPNDYDDICLYESKTVSVSGNGRYFRFVPERGGTYEIYSYDNTGDPWLNLMDATGASIGQDDDSGDGSNFMLSYRLEAGVTYYIYARAFSNGSASYKLRIDSVSLDHVPESHILLDEEKTVSVGTAGTEFRFVPEISGIYEIYSYNNTGDPYISLLNATGESVLDSDDDSGENGNFTLQYRFEAGRTYYVNPRSAHDTATYTFKIRAIELNAAPENGAVGTDVWDGSVANGFGGGNGSQNDPYLIYTADQLAYLAGSTNNGNTYSGKYFKLMNNIDLANRAWTPIGKGILTGEYIYSGAFAGYFDGSFCVVYNLNISNATSTFTGLFGTMNNGYIKNLGIENAQINVSVSGNYRSKCGALAGSVNNAVVENCYVENANVTNSATGRPASTGCLIGLLCGESTVKNCYAIGNARGTGSHVSPLVGGEYSSSTVRIENCYAVGSAHAADGGNATIVAGGIIGYKNSGTSVFIHNSFFVGTIYSASGCGTIGGSNDFQVTNCYYNISSISGSSKYTAGISSSASNFMSYDWCVSNLGWDFTDTWSFDADHDYPVLRGFVDDGYVPHVHVYEETSRTDSTCVENGVIESTCSVCGGTRRETLPLMDHEYVLQSRTEADCVNNGIETYACTMCRDSYTEVVEQAFGHDYANGTCTVCGEHVIPVYTVIESNASAYVELTESYDSVYFKFVPTVSGRYVFYSTNYTGDPYAELYDANGNYLTSNDDGGTGWNFNVYYECIANTSYYIKARMNGSGTGHYTFHVETIEIYCDHDYVLQSTTEADCDQDGVATYVCSLCHDSYTEVVEQALGHDYALQNTTVADCEHGGVGTYECMRCRDSYSEIVTPALGHNYVDGECTRCGSIRRGVVLLIEDILPWSSNANSAILQRLVDEGIIEGFEKHSSYELANGSINLYDYALVMLAADQEQSFYNNIPIDEISAYAESGGSVFLAADTSGHSGGRYPRFPFGITSTRDGQHNNYIQDYTHPMITGIYSDGRVLTNSDMYGQSMSHNYFTNYPENTNVILQDSNRRATLLEFEYGQGLVVVSGLTFECGYNNAWNFVEGYDDILIHLYGHSGNGNAHTHAFAEVSRTAATCTSDGRIDYACSCGATRVEFTSALGHNIVSTVEVQVSCTRDGLIVDRCTNDGCDYERSTVIHGEHNYSVTDRRDATCDTEGYIEYTCANCGDTNYEYFEGMHNYVESSRVEAQVDVEGSITYTCTNCHDSYSIAIPALTPVLKNSSVLLIQDTLPWAENANTSLLEALKDRGVVSSYNIISTSALASFDLSQYGVVFIANDQSTATYNRLATHAEKLESYVRAGGNLIYGACDQGWGGGSLTYTLPGGVTTSHYYSVYNYVVNELHPIVTGIYTDNRSLRDELLKGNYCSHAYFNIASLPEGTDIILRDATGNPTLIEYALGDGIVIATGLTWEYFYVRSHYEMITNYSKNAYDDLLTYMVYMSSSNVCQHVYELAEVVEPTCEENGYTKYICQLCSFEYVSDVVMAEGHTPGNWMTDTEATCATPGSRHRECTVCGAVTDTEIIPTIGHVYGDWTVETEAGCSTPGVKYADCSVCGEHRILGYVPAIGHTYTSVLTRPATCTVPGIMTYTCHTCGDSYHTYIYSEHHYEHTSRTEPTCTEDGEDVYTCLRCGNSYSIAITGGHNYVAEITLVATPDRPGEMRYTCSKCGDYYTEEIPARPNAEILLVQDRLPWSENNNVALLNAMMADGYLDGWDITTTANFGSVDLARFNVVLIANDQTTATYAQLQTLQESLVAFARAGGVVIYGACDNGWAGGTISYSLPEGVVKSNYYSHRNYIVDATHPIVMGSMTDGKGLTNDLLYGNYCSHTSFDPDTLPGSSNVILQDANGNPTLVEYAVGEGYMILSGLTWEFYYTRNAYDYRLNTTYTRNVYDDLIVYAASLASGCDHAWDDGVTVDPTCTERGYVLHTCALCERTLKENYTEAIGHNLGDWEIVTSATAQTEGLQVRRCTACGEEIEREIIPMINAATIRVESTVDHVVLGQEITFTVEISGATPIKSMALVPIFDTACFEFVSAEWLVDAFMLDIEDNTLRSIAVWTSETDVNTTVYRITLRAKVMTDHASVDFTAMLENESGLVVTSVVDKAVDVIECPHNEKTYVGIDDSYHAHVCVTCGYTDTMVEHDFDDCNTCTVCGYVVYMVGDVDGDGQINSYDTVYLLYHIFFEDSGEYPITQPCDFIGDGVTDSDDAVYLLYYIFFGEVDYPLHDAR